MRNFSNIVLIGPMGAGKTSTGKALAQTIAWRFYDSDQVIESRAGVDLLWIYDVEGKKGFKKREEQVIRELMQKKNIILATGGETISNPSNRTIVQANGLIVYLSVSLQDQLLRTSYSKKRPLARENSLRLTMLKKLHEEQLPLYENLADIIYPTDNKSTKTMVKDLISLLSEKIDL